MQGLAGVSLFANRANHYQVALPILTDDGSSGRLDELVIGGNFLPLLDALGAKTVLALCQNKQ